MFGEWIGALCQVRLNNIEPKIYIYFTLFFLQSELPSYIFLKIIAFVVILQRDYYKVNNLNHEKIGIFQILNSLHLKLC